MLPVALGPVDPPAKESRGGRGGRARELPIHLVQEGHPMRTRPARNAGFTLIELLVVVAILGILAAIAIQMVNRYRATAYDALAMHDLGNAVNAEEAYFATNASYVTFSATGPGLVEIPGVAVSTTVTIDMTALDGESFEGLASSNRGTGKVFSYDSITDTFINQ
jgi:prepilin-type N-terminal cleavage/methylation domain-containing protein